MQLVADGPDIPLEILDAQEEGELALFCGAGISFPNDLPLFGALVEGVKEYLRASWEPEEKRAYLDYHYDRVLGLLERPHRFPEQMRPAVQSELSLPDDPDTDTHEALIDLARDDYGKGDLHLVTTNFDLLFKEADRNFQKAAAPRLPIPKRKKWNELVYLHGYFGQPDPDGRHLVLTSADFGIAYLTERWASRFVSELFNHFTVLFIGYSVNDPVMRYLVDAIAADREQGIDDRLREAYAFASYKEGEKENVKNEWATKNITPILYPEDDGHTRLHKTLREWAQFWRGGLRSKKNIVSTHGTKSPETLTEEISQVRWAISDPSGAVAREFASLERKAPIEWLEVFDKEGFTSYAISEERQENNIPLVDAGSVANNPSSLSQVTSGIAEWLTTHLNKPTLFRWVIQKGGHLHPEFRRMIQRKLAEGGPPEPYRTIWQVLARSESVVCGSFYRFNLRDRLSNEEWNAGLQSDLLSALTPCIGLRPRTLTAGYLSERVRSDAEPVNPSDLVWMDVETRSRMVDNLITRLEERSDHEDVLRDTAFDLAHLLLRAMELYEVFGRVTRSEDAIHIQRPSIPPHDQNSNHHGWTALVDLLREAYHVLSQREPSQARIMGQFFATRRYPLFRRFALYGFTTESNPEASLLLEHILNDSTAWLWSTSVQVELFRALPALWDALEQEERPRLAETISEGPPRAKYKEDISTDEWTRLRDRATWNRLIRIHSQSDADLTAEAFERLEEIAQRYPDWEFTGDEKEDFPTWMEMRSGFETDYTADALLDQSDEKIANILVTHDDHRRGLLDSWRRAVSQEPRRGLAVLELLFEREYYQKDVWSSSFRGFREVEVEEDLHVRLLTLINRLPEDPIHSLADSLSSLMGAIAQIKGEAFWDVLLDQWDRLWPATMDYPSMADSDPLTTAINHPAGKLAEVLFYLLGSEDLSRHGGIPTELRSRFEEIIEQEGEAARLARVIIASHLAVLYFLDPTWTEENVVPLFDWASTEKASSAWEGYLWSPSMRPDLWSAMKAHFLRTFEHLDLFERTAQRNLAALLAAVAIEGEHTLTDDEARQCLRQMDDQGRTDVAQWIVDRLQGAEERADVLWVNRIGPWIDAVWPREAGLRSSEASNSLAWAAIESGEAFPSAVETVGRLISALERPHGIVDKFVESDHTTAYPEASLELLNRLIDDIQFRHTAEVLQQCLNEIAESEPSLADDGRYIRLQGMADQIVT